MTKKLERAIESMRRWPSDRQDAAAEALLEAEAQQDAAYHLTAEQAAEVERRLADPNPRFLSLADLRARLARLGA